MSTTVATKAEKKPNLAGHAAAEPYKPKNKVRIVTAASLFDGHDAAINIMRRIIQATGCLNDSAHDVDGCIVPIKQASRCNDADFIFGFVRLCGCVASEVGLLFGFSGDCRAHENLL